MICKNCGGKIKFENGFAVCSSCSNKYQIDTAFDNTDVFICYVENDSNGRRTKDSIVANDIYQKLTNAKINAFYQRVSASDLFEDDFEQAIYQGIYNSKIVLILGTNTQNFELLLDTNREYFGDKKILPVYSDMSAYDVPSELGKYQALNYDSIGASSDLVKNTLTLLGRQDEIDTEELSNKTAKKRRNRLIIIIASILALCIGIGSYIFFGTPYVLTSKKYEYAMQLYEQEKYIDGLNMFLKIDGYKNSNNLIDSIYNKYDGYYQTKDKSLSLHVDIKNKSFADIEVVKKYSDQKIVSFNASAEVNFNLISMNFTDSESNQGSAKIDLNNKGLVLTTKIKTKKSDLSIGENKIEFKLKDKSDKPIVEKITQKTIKKWLTEKTSIADLKRTGYELEFIDYSGIRNMVNTLASTYSIKNTDIKLFILDYEPNIKDTSSYDFLNEPSEESIVYAVSAPAQTLCPNLIGEETLVCVEEDIAYVPVGTFCCGFLSGLSESPFSDTEIFSGIDFNIEGETLPEIIETTTEVCATSKFLLGDEIFKILIDCKQVDLLTIKLEKMYEKEHDLLDAEIYVLYEAESNENFLFYVSEDNNENVDAFYKADKNTGEIEFIVELEYDNDYYSYYDDTCKWKDYPEYFREFMTAEEYEEVTTCYSCGETISNPRDYDGECEDCYNGIYED